MRNDKKERVEWKEAARRQEREEREEDEKKKKREEETEKTLSMGKSEGYPRTDNRVPALKTAANTAE